jgi:hypothetical protein
MNWFVYKLSHLSTPGMPANPEYGKDYFGSTRFEFTTPGDMLYLVNLNLDPDDASQHYQRYVFLPLLRRPLTISTVARCSYEGAFGTVSDALEEDVYIRLGSYRYTLLGQKKLLFLVHATNEPAVATSMDSVNLTNSRLPGWPKPVMGKWELRDVYLVDATPLPAAGSPCFGHRLFYLDKHAWVLPLIEDYDDKGRLWKTSMATFSEIVGNAGDGDYMAFRSLLILNLKESHATVSMTKAPIEIDNEVPSQYRDAASAAVPSAVHAVNR